MKKKLQRIPLKWVGIGFAFLIALFFPTLLTQHPFYLHVLIMILFYAFFATTWNLTTGYTGLLSVMHPVFFGIGAYISVMFQRLWGVSPWLCIPIGVIISVCLSLAFNYPAARLKGLFLAMASLAFLQAILIIFYNWRDVGGSEGISLPVMADSLLNFQFNSVDMRIMYYYIMLSFLIVELLIIHRIMKSKTGYYFIAIREDEIAASSIGINVVKYKLLAGAISAALCSVLGSFYIQYFLLIDPEGAFSVKFMFEGMVITLLGGIGSLLGPLIGSMVIVPLDQYTRMRFGGSPMMGLSLVIYGAVMIVISLFFTGGIMGYITNLRGKLKSRLNT